MRSKLRSSTLEILKAPAYVLLSMLVAAVLATACSSGSTVTANPETGTNPGEPGTEAPSSSSTGDVIEALVVADADEAFTAIVQADPFEDSYVGLLVAGDCANAWGFNAANFNAASDYDVYAEDFCDRVAGSAPTREYVGETGEGYFGEKEHTIGYRIGDEFLLVKVYDGAFTGSVVGLAWGPEPRDIETTE